MKSCPSCSLRAALSSSFSTTASSTPLLKVHCVLRSSRNGLDHPWWIARVQAGTTSLSPGASTRTEPATLHRLVDCILFINSHHAFHPELHHRCRLFEALNSQGDSECVRPSVQSPCEDPLLRCQRLHNFSANPSRRSRGMSLARQRLDKGLRVASQA